MEDYTDNDSICSFDTIDQGWSFTASGRIIIEEESKIYTERCANCYRYVDFNSFTAQEKSLMKYRYKNQDKASFILYFCCKGCRLWALFKLKRNRHRPRHGCICKVSLQGEGVKYIPPLIHHNPGNFHVITLEEVNYVEEVPFTLTELFKEFSNEKVNRPNSRSRSR